MLLFSRSGTQNAVLGPSMAIEPRQMHVTAVSWPSLLGETEACKQSLWEGHTHWEEHIVYSTACVLVHQLHLPTLLAHFSHPKLLKTVIHSTACALVRQLHLPTLLAHFRHPKLLNTVIHSTACALVRQLHLPTLLAHS